jgi:hypothetical protein
MGSTAVHHEAVMSGHGFYNKHSAIQATAAEFGLAALREAADAAPIPLLSRFTDLDKSSKVICLLLCAIKVSNKSISSGDKS